MTRTDPTGRSLPHLRLFCLTLAALLLSGTAGAATLTVTSTADPGDPGDGQCTLREAVDAINNGSNNGGCTGTEYGTNDTIVFAPEAAGETIQLADAEGQLTLSSPVTINGNDPDAEDGTGVRVTIDANGTEDEPSDNQSRIFRLNADTATLRNLFLAGGRAIDTDGGAILVNSGASLTAERVGISDSRATGTTDGTGRGGGIFIADGGSIVEFRNSAIGSSRAERGGGAIYDNSGVAGSVTIIGSTFNQNRAGVYVQPEPDNGDDQTETVPDPDAEPADGGALYLPMGGDILDEDGDSSNLSDNTATGSGGSIWTDGETTIRNSLVLSSTAYGDEAGDGGGNIYAAANANLMLRLTTINNGEAVGETNGAGGGVVVSGGNLDSDVSVVSANYAEVAGGAVALRNSATATFARTVLSANGAQDPNNPEESAVTPEGGALHADGAGDISLDGGGLENNIADVSGGGIWSNDSNVTVSGTEVRNNNARGDATDNGGGAFRHGGTGTLSIIESRLIGNNASGDAGSGGVILMAGGTLEVSDSRFTRNSAERAGGAIEITGGTAEFTGVTLGGSDSGDGNMVGTNPGNGGAMHVGGGTVTVADSTVAYNTAVQGGGLWNGDGSTLTVRNSTISNNQATSSEENPGDGGGLYQVAGGTDLSFATVVRNTAENQGGGIAVGQGDAESVTASASIIAENTAANGDDFAEGAVALQGDGNVTGEAGLDGLQLFGGPTLTHPLATDSPALDVAAGCDTAPLDLDQRGAQRPADGDGDGTVDCDAGSFERTDDPVVSVSANGPQSIGANIGEDLLVLAFKVRNESDQSITLDGFDAEPLLNSGYAALLGLLPAGFDPDDPLQFEVVEDTDGDGQIDEGETQVVGEDANDRGRNFTFTGGLELPANDSRNLVVVFRAPEVPEDDQDGAVQQATSGSKPLYAGGTALAMLGVFCLSGVRRRTRWLLALAVLVAGLTACSNADDEPPEDPAFIGDPELQGNIRFALTELRETTGAEGEILIGDGLPVYGPGIFTP